MTRILVTGAKGFVGQALTKRLLDVPNLEVVAVTRQKLPARDNLVPIAADLSQPGWTSTLDGRVDIVLHLAQSSQYQRFPDGGPDMVRVNIDSTAELLDWGRRNGVGRFIFTSTGSVYRSSTQPLNETSACDAADMYAATKLSAEHIIMAYRPYFSVVIGRLFGIYGPGQTKGLFRTLYDRLGAGQPISLADGKGLSITPLFIDDCAEALTRLATIANFDKEAETYNIAGGEIADIRQIVDVMAMAGCGTASYKSVPGPAPSLIADNSKLITALKWKPETDLRSGIASMVQSLANKPAKLEE